MQHIKGTTQIGVLKEVASSPEKLTDSLAKVIDRFKLKQHFSKFDALKAKGASVSNLLTSLVIMPFVGAASVYAMQKHGIVTSQDLQSKKDAYYTAKNSEGIDWRFLLLSVAKQFAHLVRKEAEAAKQRITAIVFDDTLLAKTGKGIEMISMVHDHVGQSLILGFKLMVCGFWDGGSFLPLDFVLHREKGTKQEFVAAQYFKATKIARATRALAEKLKEALSQKQNRLTCAEQAYSNKADKSGLNRLGLARCAKKKAESSLQVCEKQLVIDDKAQKQAKKELKRFYIKGRLFGLTAKERKQQYKKAVSAKSHGFKRRKEADLSKMDSMFAMLHRAVKNGFVPRYVLTDSWFFSEALVAHVKGIKNGIIDLVSMVKINNQVFAMRDSKVEIGVKPLLNANKGKSKRCRALHSHYIKCDCEYKGLAINLFFVKMGRSDKWHLIATTDLGLDFISLMQVYQIRWSIEVFFKECKQYLNLGGCKSSNFDAQIADTTISMIQHTMLSYCKRINYQTSFGDLFIGLHDERAEHNLVSKLMRLFWQLVEIFCDSSGFDFIAIQADIMQNQQMLDKFAKLIPEKVLDNAA
jgi:hypothetical protein